MSEFDLRVNQVLDILAQENDTVKRLWLGPRRKSVDSQEITALRVVIGQYLIAADHQANETLLERMYDPATEEMMQAAPHLAEAFENTRANLDAWHGLDAKLLRSTTSSFSTSFMLGVALPQGTDVKQLRADIIAAVADVCGVESFPTGPKINCEP